MTRSRCLTAPAKVLPALRAYNPAVQLPHSAKILITHPAELALVEGCKYDFSVTAAILTQKFAFHCPTYREQDWFAQCGWFPSRSTLNELINTSVMVVCPLFWQMWQLLLQQRILLTDDTRLLLLTRDALTREQLESLRKRRRSGTPPGDPPELDDRGSVTSYARLYRGLDGLTPYNIFHWSLTHEHAVVDAHLASLRGARVEDAFSGYTHIEERSQGRIVHASCNGHARREFVKAEVSEPLLSAQAQSLYAQLYDVEERGKTLDLAGLHALRQRDATAIWNRFDRWLDSEPVQRVLPQSPLGRCASGIGAPRADPREEADRREQACAACSPVASGSSPGPGPKLTLAADAHRVSRTPPTLRRGTVVAIQPESPQRSPARGRPRPAASPVPRARTMHLPGAYE